MVKILNPSTVTGFCGGELMLKSTNWLERYRSKLIIMLDARTMAVNLFVMLCYFYSVQI